MATKPKYYAKSWMFELSFWLVVIVGAAMAIMGILNVIHSKLGLEWGWFSTLLAAVQHVCFTIGMFIPVVMSYQVARRKTTVWFVLWIIFVILVVVGIITTIL